MLILLYFIYYGIQLFRFTDGRLDTAIKKMNVQVMKINKVADCMNDFTWNIEYLRKDASARIYKIIQDQC